MLLKLYNCSITDLPDFDEVSKEHWDSLNNKAPAFDKEMLKNFHVIKAETKDGKTAGYLFYILFKSMYHDEIWCQVDIFYLKPEYRSKGTGTKMFNLLEKEAKERGASKIMASYNLKQPLEGFYNNMGYSNTHVAVAKEI